MKLSNLFAKTWLEILRYYRSDFYKENKNFLFGYNVVITLLCLVLSTLLMCLIVNLYDFSMGDQLEDYLYSVVYSPLHANRFTQLTLSFAAGCYFILYRIYKTRSWKNENKWTYFKKEISRSKIILPTLGFSILFILCTYPFGTPENEATYLSENIYYNRKDFLNGYLNLLIELIRYALPIMLLLVFYQFYYTGRNTFKLSLKPILTGIFFYFLANQLFTFYMLITKTLFINWVEGIFTTPNLFVPFLHIMLFLIFAALFMGAFSVAMFYPTEYYLRKEGGYEEFPVKKQAKKD